MPLFLGPGHLGLGKNSLQGYYLGFKFIKKKTFPEKKFSENKISKLLGKIQVTEQTCLMGGYSRDFSPKRI